MLPVFSAFVEDKYLNTLTPVSLTEVTIVPFTATTVAASKATDRFRLVYRTSGVLPINFTHVKAFEKGSGIQVEWNLGNENNIARYEIEKSADGRLFSKAGLQTVRSITSSDNYQWLDAQPVSGTNFYRIKAYEQNGVFKYSEIVSVKTGKGATSIQVYPNPVTNKVMNLQWSNQPKGKYGVTLFTTLGQKVYHAEFNHDGGSASQSIKLSNRVVKGVYQLQVTGRESKTTQQVIIE